MLAGIAVVLGFIHPGAWWAAAILGMMAVLARPAGMRADRRPRTGGVLGGWIDRSAERPCPTCRNAIPREVSRCPVCRAEMAPQVKRCPSCGAANRIEDRICLNCSGAI